MANKYWIWGYVMKEVPEKLPYMRDMTYCSLETAANYFGADNVVYLNSAHSMDAINDTMLDYIKDKSEVICALTHRQYAESAKLISEYSLKYPNITGCIIDDFLDDKGPSDGMTVDELRVVSENMKSANPNLKLWVVRYSRYPIEQIEPYLEYIDGVNFWVWVSTEHYWRYQYPLDLKKLGAYGKPVLQGVFLNNYGEGLTDPVPLDLLELQMVKITKQMLYGDHHYGEAYVDGCVLLQNGWMGKESHRKETMWLKSYLDWQIGTTTIR